MRSRTCPESSAELGAKTLRALPSSYEPVPTPETRRSWTCTVISSAGEGAFSVQPGRAKATVCHRGPTSTVTPGPERDDRSEARAPRSELRLEGPRFLVVEARVETGGGLVAPGHRPYHGPGDAAESTRKTPSRGVSAPR